MNESCTLVFFGSTGNLAQIKLLPALYHLELGGHLAPSVRVIGFGRRDWSDEHWRGEVRRILDERIGSPLDALVLERMLERQYFVQGDLEDQAGYERLAARLNGDEGFATNLVFYLAIAPTFYGTTADRLAAEGLNNQQQGWSRLVVEKPFGYDLESAEI
ncbi:MAG: glucose-6-phosphate dehydrogenase, partial [Thiohalocapsa sp.]